MVSYRVLGDFALLDEDGRPIRIPAGRTQHVLAKLLVNHDRVVSNEELMRAGWGDDEASRDQLYKRISDINAKLGPRDGMPRVENMRNGYRLHVFPTDEVDFVQFDQAVAEAGRASDRARELLRGALALWRGPRALANFPDDVLAGEVDRLGRRLRAAATRLLELEINDQGYAPVVAEAVAYAELFPTDPRLAELAMIAAYRCDQIGDAARVYEHHEQALEVDSLGTRRPETRRLCYAALAADETVVAERERALGLNPPVSSAGRVPVELRAAPPRLIARDDLLAEATWLLSRPGTGGPPVVLVISGRSGIGKTAMARSVAHTVLDKYDGGALYLELRDATGEPVDASEALAHALRALDVRVPESRAERARALRTELARRQMLIVLDDAHDENQVRDLVPGSGSSAVIITTNHDLPGLEGAYTLRTLVELTAAESLDLYRDLTRANRFDPDADDAALTERLLALCDGLPLAISVVAALRVRDRARPIADLADRVERMGPVALEYDNRSVARSIGASLERLDDDAQALFIGLGRVHLAEIGAWTAWAVLDAGPDADQSGPDVYGALSQLLASNVLIADTPGRYRLHALTRRYAAWRAEQTGPDDGVAQRVYRAKLTLVRRAHRGLYGGGDYEVVHSAVPDWPAAPALLAELARDPLAWFDRARANIRAAVQHCAELGHHELAWDLAVSSHEYYTVAGQHDDWYDTHTKALAACRAAGDLRGEAVLLISLGQPALVASRRNDTFSLAELRRAAEILREHGDDHGRAIALRTLGNALRREGRLDEPLRLFAEALELYGRSDDAVGRWQTQRFIGQTYLDLGDHEEAVKVLGEALDVATRLGSPRLQAQSHYWLGQAYLATAHPSPDVRLEDAQASFRDMLALIGEAPSLGRGYALHGLGEVARRRGALPEAQAMLAESATLAREGRDAGLEGRVHLAVAGLRHSQGRPEEQLAALAEAVACFASGDNRFLELAALAATSRAHPAGSTESQLAWQRVEARYSELDLPPADRVHRPPP
jgi:DNA-binding SARP family transcriptional activator